MQKREVPPYKPSPQIQELIDKHKPSGQRRRTAVLPTRNWIQRNPRIFQFTVITVSMLIFFSRPLYDAFIAVPLPPPPGGPLPAHKR